MPERPATYRDIIAAEAKKARVPPELAFAIVDVESGGKPDAVSPKGARGFFQLMPETAKGLGVDPDDPVQNIRGGLTYFRQMLDQHGGDVNKALTAYNWGPGNLAKGGQPPPETIDYVQRVTTRWNPQPQAQRTSTVGQPPPKPINVTTARPEDFGGPTLGQRAASGALSVLESFDPRTSSGRRNIAGGIGGAAAIAATGGAATPAIVPFIAGVTGAAGGGMLAEAGEQIVGTAPPSALGVVGAGAEQAAYEVAGQALTWPIRAVGRRVVGSQLAQRTAARFNSLLEGATAAIQGAREFASEAVAGARARAGELVSGAQVAKEAKVAGAEAAKEAAVTASKAQSEGLTRAVGERYAALGTPPPGGATRAGRQAQGVITGPAKSARDMIGEQVDEAARQGPPVDVTQLKAEAQRILAEEIRPPQEAFPRAAAEVDPNIEQLARIAESPALSPEAMSRMLPSQRAQAEGIHAALAAAREEQVQTTLKHPAMQVLGRILNAEDTVPFHQAHQFKRELDEAIGTAWDRSVKARVTNITKTLRGTLRESLRGFGPYDAATSAYAAIAPLYTKGLAPQLRRVATEDPGAVVRLINPKQAEKLRMLRDLLVEQPGKVGEREQGLAAWDSVRAAWTYDRLIKGPIEGLENRLAKLDPEFTNIMYDDVPGRTVLQNLKLISTAYREALEAGESNLAQAVAAGKAGVRAARQVGTEGIAEARALGRQEVTGARRAGREAVREALTSKAVTAREARKFAKSTLVRGKDTEVLPDVLRATALGPGSIWGALSLVRLLRGPRAADLIEYASRDSKTTQLLVKAFTGPEMGDAAANFLRLASGPLGDLVPPEPVGTPPPSTPTAAPRGLAAGLGPPP